MSIHRETHNDFLIDEKALTFHDFDLIWFQANEWNSKTNWSAMLAGWWK
jgi:hypothetical protein